MSRPIKAMINAVGKIVISTGERGISKSSILGLYEPEIPDELQKVKKTTKELPV